MIRFLAAFFRWYRKQSQGLQFLLMIGFIIGSNLMVAVVITVVWLIDTILRGGMGPHPLQ